MFQQQAMSASSWTHRVSSSKHQSFQLANRGHIFWIEGDILYWVTQKAPYSGQFVLIQFEFYNPWFVDNKIQKYSTLYFCTCISIRLGTHCIVLTNHMHNLKIVQGMLKVLLKHTRVNPELGELEVPLP